MICRCLRNELQQLQSAVRAMSTAHVSPLVTQIPRPVVPIFVFTQPSSSKLPSAQPLFTVPSLRTPD